MSVSIKEEQMIKDIKRLLISETAFTNDWGSESAWENDEFFMEIANRYGITKYNILGGLNQSDLESIKEMSLDEEVREELERRLK